MPDGWPQNLLDELKRVTSDDFEAVDTAETMISLNSGQAGPLPPLTEVTIDTHSTTLSIRLSQGQVFSLVLTSDTTLSALTDLMPGQMATFRICQDPQGGHRFQWPATVRGAMTVGTAKGKCSVQSFVATADGLYAAAPGVIDE